jgi:membrane-bound lytic murein transglycosylase B
MDETTQRPVRMTFEPQDTTDADEACQLVGRFRRKAREQGWTEEAIEWATRGVTVRRVVEQLLPHVEPTGPEPLSWRTQYDRTRDYVEGGRVLASDQAAEFRPLRFLARGFTLALRGGTR